MSADLVRILREKAAGKRNAVGDVWGDHICGDAADHIEALSSENEKLKAALEPFAARKLPNMRRTEIGYDSNGLRRCISPFELAQVRARAALKGEP